MKPRCSHGGFGHVDLMVTRNAIDHAGLHRPPRATRTVRTPAPISSRSLLPGIPDGKQEPPVPPSACLGSARPAGDRTFPQSYRELRRNPAPLRGRGGSAKAEARRIRPDRRWRSPVLRSHRGAAPTRVASRSASSLAASSASRVSIRRRPSSIPRWDLKRPDITKASINDSPAFGQHNISCRHASVLSMDLARLIHDAPCRGLADVA